MSAKKSSENQGLDDKLALLREVREKNAYLANLLRDSYDAIVGVDLDGTIRSWNRGAWEMFEYEPDEIIGHSFRLVMPAGRNSDDEFQNILHEITTRGFINDTQTVRRTKTGREIICSVTRTAVRDDLGNVIGFSAIFRDITERTRMEQRLIASERMSALGEMAAFLAHEIKNPLNSMVINLEVMKGLVAGLEPSAGAKINKYVGVISGEIESLDKVIRAVLDLARPVGVAEHAPVNLESAVGELIALVSPKAVRAGIEIRSDFGQDFPILSADLNGLKQVFLNLLLNAMDALPNGGAIAVEGRQTGDSVRLRVVDNGVGIPPETLTRIFDPFFTTKPKGNGIGLAVVQRVIHTHGGTVHAYSSPGCTEFVITLPINGHKA